MIHGIAAMLMVFHHLFGFPDRVNVPFVMLFDFSFLHVETILSYWGRICISMFAFCSGYGLCKLAFQNIYEKKNLIVSGYQMVISQLKKFYPRLWLVCFIFIPLGYLMGVYQFNAIIFLKSLIGISSFYNAEWWYTAYYLRFLLLFPILYSILVWVYKQSKKCSTLIVFTAIFAITVFYILLPEKGFWSTFLCFLMGMVVVAFDLFEMLYQLLLKLGKWQYILSVTVGLLAVFARIVLKINCDYDYIVTPILIFCILVIMKSKLCSKYIKPPLTKLGKYSTYIWLTHTFFVYYYFQKLTYAPRYSTLIFIWCLFLSIASGILMEKILYFVQIGIGRAKIRS